MGEFDSGRRFVLKSVVGGIAFGVGTGTVSGDSGDAAADDVAVGFWEDPADLVASISTDDVAEAITGVEYRGRPEQVEVFEQELQDFPLEDDSYVVLSSGVAADVSGEPEAFVSTGVGGRNFENYSPDDFDAFDVAEIRIDLAVPEGAEGIAFDYKFGSEENPDYLDSNYQDFFEANLVRPNVGATNIGLLPDGSPVTVDNADEFANSPSGWSDDPTPPLPDPADVTYNSVTDLQTASASLSGSSGDAVRLILRIGDASDGIYDSAVFLDNLRFVDDVEVSPVLVENALKDYESTARWGIERHVRAVADRDARLYAAYGDAYAESVVDTLGYLAGEVSTDALDEELLEALEAAVGDVTVDQAGELYEFFDGLFESVTENVASFGPPSDVFFERYWNEYPLHGPDGDAVRTYAELDSAYESAFEERTDAFLAEVESEGYSGGETDTIVGYLNARSAEHAEAAQKRVDELEDQAEALVADDGEIGGRVDVLRVPTGTGGGGSAIRTGAHLLVHAGKGTATLGATPPAPESGTWVSDQSNSNDASVQLGTWAEADSALREPSAVSSFFTALSHATAFRAVHAGHALRHAWELTESDAGFVAGVVDDSREQTAALDASSPAEAIEIAGRGVEIGDLTVQDVTVDDAIDSEAGLVGERTGTITIENTGSDAFAPVPTGTIVADTVIVDAQSHSTGYPMVLSEEVPVIEPGESASVEFRYAVPIDLLPTTYTFVASVVGHDAAASATFTAGGSEPEGVSTETVAQGELTDGATESTTHAPADGTATLSYELEYSQLDADLHLYDEFGNHTGVDSSTEELQNEVPGSTHSGPDEGVSGTESVTVKNPASNEYTITVETPEIETIVQLDDGTLGGDGAGAPPVGSAQSPAVDSRARRSLPNLYAVGAGVNIEYAINSTQVPELPPTLSVSLDQAPPIVDHGDQVTVSMRISETGMNADATGLSASVSELTAEDGDDAIDDVSVVDDSFDVAAGASRTFSVEVAVPDDVSPDAYSGTVSVSDADGNVDADGTVRVAFATEETDDPEDGTDPTTESEADSENGEEDDDAIPGFGPLAGAAGVASGAYAANRIRERREADDGDVEE